MFRSLCIRRRLFTAGRVLQKKSNASEIREIVGEFGDLEADQPDLINAHKFHKNYEKERYQEAEKLRHHIIKAKYFSTSKGPNFLTYAEKEQIRLLHSRDPEEWSVEVLAESFPANIEIIRKVLKANWRPLSEKRIRHHDASVSKCWHEFLKGDLNSNLSTSMIDHLKTFTAREKSLSGENSLPQRLRGSTQMSKEFSSIITACQKKEHKLKSLQDNEMTSPNHGNLQETHLLMKVVNKKYVRINELKVKLGMDMLDHPPVERRQGSGCLINEHMPPQTSHIEVTNTPQKLPLNEVVISDELKKKFEISAAKDRVHIPRKIWRKGTMYHIEDCYYDDDGELLYRVPGKE